MHLRTRLNLPAHTVPARLPASKPGDAMALPFSDASFDHCGLRTRIEFHSPTQTCFRRNASRHGSGRRHRHLRLGLRGGCALSAQILGCSRCHRPGSFGLRSGPPLPHVQSRFSEQVIRKRFATRRTACALDITTRFASFDDYWQPFLTGQGSAPNYLASRDESIRSAIRERLRDSIPTDSSGAIELPARAWAVRGVH